MEAEKTICERARASVSLALDGELSELEVADLDQHLLACDQCAGFASRAAVVVDAIRATPLARPTQGFELVPARRKARPMLVIAAAVAICVAAGAGAVVGTLRSSASGSSASQPAQVRSAPAVALQFAVPVRDPRAHGADF